MAIYTPLGVRLTPYCPHYPEPPQEAFLALTEREALYGGAAGGGKSDALLIGALQYVDVPSYSALLVRRTYEELAGAGSLIPRAKLWLSQTDAIWNEGRKRWTFPSGAVVEFGHVQREDDVFAYGSTEYQFIGADEVTQLTEFQWRFLMSRLRRPSDPEDPLSQVPIRARCASNPVGPGKRWVKRRFIDRQPDAEDPEDSVERCLERIFIPAKLEDNPHIDREDYERSLALLDPQTRQQLRDGDWEARPPGEWVFPIGLPEVFELGAEYDQQRLAKRMPPPVGDQLPLGVDFGVHSHVLVGWPLEAAGWYIAREIVNDVANIDGLGRRTAIALGALQWPCHSERFDASMPGLNAQFVTELNEEIPHTVKWTAVPFGKYKALTIGHLAELVINTLLRVRFPAGTGIEKLSERDARELAKLAGDPHLAEEIPLKRVRAGLRQRALTGAVLAISERHCPRLAEQLRDWKWADPDVNRTEKGNDHGPDALVALDAPVASTRRAPTKREPTTV